MINKYKIGFYILLICFIATISFVIVNFSYAAEENTSTIYSRDELSELLKNQEINLDNTLNVIEDNSLILKIYVNNERVVDLDSTKKYYLNSYSCNGSEVIKFRSNDNTILIENENKSTNCTLYFYEMTLISDIYKATGYTTFVTPATGKYFIELWGAGGEILGNGAYTSGLINLSASTQLYVYTGAKGSNTYGGYNGGGNSGLFASSASGQTPSGSGGGGGATDIRLTAGEWNNISSLRSRIMVAAGSGSGMAWIIGRAGGIIGYDGYGTEYIHHIYRSNGGSNTNGGAATLSFGAAPAATAGSFGIGGNGSQSVGHGYGGGGGGGYYGGSGGQGAGVDAWSGAGGSSYISGHTGCVAVTSATSSSPRTSSGGTACTNSINDITCSYHYSCYKFTNTTMIDGYGKSWSRVVNNEYLKIPNYSGGYYNYGTGNPSNGHAKIWRVIGL